MKKYKLIFTVPVENTDQVRQAIGEAGAGKLGNYSFCSFSSKGVGRFKPEQGANPTIGEVGKLEEVEEERVEVTCDANVLDAIIAAMKKAHPYEEVAYDVYKLEDK
ncbi:MAG: hypothetical protein Q8P58_02245 [Candidatus Adlerbacteria bacterium]|nr:hypothetical protein [Candidatus Adlerbacteria bacterium]